MNYIIILVDYNKKFEFNFVRFYEPLIDNIKENHLIPVEEMKAHVLTVSGVMYIMWPFNVSGNNGKFKRKILFIFL